MSKFLRITEWDKYQHYKDRNPPWIKLHRDLITSESWCMGNDQQKLLLVAIMILAARFDNCVPASATYIQKVAYLEMTPDIDWLVEVGFCEYCDEAGKRKSPWPSRHVAPAIREQVLERDGRKCVECGATEKLEVDHKVPVSKGGTSDVANLQTLCRPCNRRKRVSVASATPQQGPCNPETETETYIQEEPKTLAQLPLSACEAIYECYPRKIGKASAIKAVQRALGRLVKGEYQNKKLLLVEAVAGLKNRTLMFADSAAGKKANYTPHPATWFNRSSYLDDPKEWQDDEQQVVSKSTTRAQSNADAIRAGLGIGGDAAGLRNDAGPGSASGGDEDLGPDVWERKAGEVEMGLRGTPPAVKVLSKASGHY